jgi:hypothetical protein
MDQAYPLPVESKFANVRGSSERKSNSHFASAASTLMPVPPLIVPIFIVVRGSRGNRIDVNSVTTEASSCTAEG